MKKATGMVIKAFRKHLDYKQEFVANKLNITVSCLANIENGRVGMDIEKLYLASKVFKIPIKDLIILITEVYDTGNDNGLAGALKYLKPILPDEDHLDEKEF